MSERKNIESSRKRYQSFITSERKPKKRSNNSSSGNPITSSGDPITISNVTGSGDLIISSGDPITSGNITSTSTSSGKSITKKSGDSEPMTRDRSSGSEPISITGNRQITFKKWGMKSNEEGNRKYL